MDKTKEYTLKSLRDNYLAGTEENPIPFSWSQLGTISRCHLKSFFDYVMKYRKYMPSAFEGADHGRDFHAWAQHGFENMAVEDDEVFMFTDDEWDNDIPAKFHESLQWLEDWMNTFYQTEGSLPKVYMEYKAEDQPEKVGDVWIQRIGYIDLLWEYEDGSYFIWDFKTGNDKDKEGRTASKVSKGMQQQYWYRGIIERTKTPKEFENEEARENNVVGKVRGVGLIYPETKSFHRRLDKKVPRGINQTSKIRGTTITKIEEKVVESINNVVNKDITAGYDAYWCEMFCSYVQMDHQICDTEECQDISKFRHVDSYEELLQFVVL